MSQKEILERAKDEFDERLESGVKRCYIEEGQLVVVYGGNPYSYSEDRKELKEKFGLVVVDNQKSADAMPVVRYEVDED